jgi:hypothetical protein
MSSRRSRYNKLHVHLDHLLNTDPALAVTQARQIDLDTPDRLNWLNLRASILVNGGTMTQQQDAIEEGLALFQELHSLHPTTAVTYNLANALVATIGRPPGGPNWLAHQERYREHRAQARRNFWKVGQDVDAETSLRTQAWTNLSNQFSHSLRLGEAHDARLAALEIDPENGVAAFHAARDLLWLFEQGGCSDLTRIEAIMMAKIAHRNESRIVEYAGLQAAKEIAAFAKKLGDPPTRTLHTDSFIRWVEAERLTLAPVVELVDPTLGKLDWLTLPGILEREPDAAATPPPLFAMFNMLKSDFILARDLAWRSFDESVWPMTGRLSDTLDYATYGPDTSALILAHRTALDLLDKVAVTANHYFELGHSPTSVSFGSLWRGVKDKVTGVRPLATKVESVIKGGAKALYGLVELAEDYAGEEGILRPQKNLRNSGTHRFVVLHDFGSPATCRQAPEVEHHRREQFTQEVMSALRVARSAIQMLALAVTQHEKRLEQREGGLVGSMIVPDHDWIRGRDESV